MTRVRTDNSTYEIDQEARLVRRVSGLREPSPRQGQDGVWQAYTFAHIELGQPMVIDYTGEGRCTVTSNVLEIT